MSDTKRFEERPESSILRSEIPARVRGRLRRRIALLVGVVALTSTSLILVSLWSGFQQGVSEEVGEIFETHSRNHLSSLDHLIRGCVSQVTQLGQLLGKEKTLTELSHGKNPLDDYRGSCLPYRNILILSPKGRVLMARPSNPSLLTRQVIQERRVQEVSPEQATVHWIGYADQRDRHDLVIVSPLLREKERKTWEKPPKKRTLLAVVMDGDQLTRWMPKHDLADSKTGRASQWLLLNQQKEIVGTSGLTDEIVALHESASHWILRPSVLQGHRVETLDQMKWIVGFASLGSDHAYLPRWSLLSMRKTGWFSPFALKGFRDSAWLIALFGIFGLTVAGVAVGWVFGGRLQRRLEELVGVIDKIRKSGSLHPRCEEKGDGEITALCRSFNRMLDVLGEKTASLVRREQEAREAHRTTTQLIVSGLAHQLNNPLSGMMDCVEELQRGELDRKTAEEYVDLIGSGLNRIYNVVSRLSKLDLTAGNDKYITEVETVVRSVIGLRQVQIERKKLHVELTADAWIVVRVDPTVFSDIVDNLLSNAIEASKREGSISIKITQKSENRVEMLVEDHGVGMREDDVAHIFEPFYSRRKGGVGLGMWTVKAYMDAIGGSVEVDSVFNQGTTFRVYVPDAGREEYGARA